MAEFPMLPLWTDAYLGDTFHLNTTQHGAYLLLLITMWRTKDCTLPNDDQELARYTRMTVDRWRKAKPVLMPFFRVEGDRIVQPRLRDEWELVRRHRQSQRASQSKKARARWASKPLKNNEPGYAAASPGHMPKTCRGYAYPSPIEEEEDFSENSEILDEGKKEVLRLNAVRSAAGIRNDVPPPRWSDEALASAVETWLSWGLKVDDVVAVAGEVAARIYPGTMGQPSYLNKEMKVAAQRAKQNLPVLNSTAGEKTDAPARKPSAAQRRDAKQTAIDEAKRETIERLERQHRADQDDPD